MFLNKVVTLPEMHSYWESQALAEGTVISDFGSGEQGFQRLTIQWNRTVPTGAREDLVTCNLTIGKDVGGDLVSWWNTGGEYTTVEGRIDTFVNSLAGKQSNQYTCVGYLWHIVHIGRPSTPHGVGPDIGPFHRFTAKSIAGSNAASRGADQLATSITLRTCSRKHWGRIYVPGLNRALPDTTYGRLGTVDTDDFATYMRTLGTGLATDGYRLGVFSPTGRAFLDVAAIECDNVIDIQRRRRPKQSSYKKIYTS